MFIKKVHYVVRSRSYLRQKRVFDQGCYCCTGKVYFRLENVVLYNALTLRRSRVIYTTTTTWKKDGNVFTKLYRRTRVNAMIASTCVRAPRQRMRPMPGFKSKVAVAGRVKNMRYGLFRSVYFPASSRPRLEERETEGGACQHVVSRTRTPRR